MQAIFSYCICRYFGYSITFKSRHDMIYLGIRSFIFVVHSFILGWTQFYLPLYAVHTISGFGPIFVCILNYFLNGVKINGKQLLGILVAFCGIILTVNGRRIWGLIDPSFHFQS
jgi:drug/metabolite transporter (DMT)-like permease